MQLTVNSQSFAAELRLLAKIAPTKPAIPILSHVLLRADDTLRLYATDLELALITTCPARITTPGVVALPVAKLLAMVEQFVDGDVSIAFDKGKATIKSGAFKSTLQVMPPEDFPSLPEPEGIRGALDGRAFRQMIGRTRYAVTSEDTRYFLSGALLTLAGPTAAMCATDGKRLALATMPRIGADARIIIPSKTLGVLASQSDANVELTVGAQHLFFASGERLLISRMIDGEFPRYERIIPKSNDKVVPLDRAAFAAALRRVGLVSEENRAVYLALSSQTLDLSSSSVEVGSADERLTVNYEGDELRICVSSGYVLDFLNAAVGSSVTMALKDASSALLFSDGDDSIAVIMPLRL